MATTAAVTVCTADADRFAAGRTAVGTGAAVAAVAEARSGRYAGSPATGLPTLVSYLIDGPRLYEAAATSIPSAAAPTAV